MRIEFGSAKACAGRLEDPARLSKAQGPNEASQRVSQSASQPASHPVNQPPLRLSRKSRVSGAFRKGYTHTHAHTRAYQRCRSGLVFSVVGGYTVDGSRQKQRERERESESDKKEDRSNGEQTKRRRRRRREREREKKRGGRAEKERRDGDRESVRGQRLCYSRTATPPRVKPRACRSAAPLPLTKTGRDSAMLLSLLPRISSHAAAVFTASRTQPRPIRSFHPRIVGSTFQSGK